MYLFSDFVRVTFHQSLTQTYLTLSMALMACEVRLCVCVCLTVCNIPLKHNNTLIYTTTQFKIYSSIDAFGLTCMTLSSRATCNAFKLYIFYQYCFCTTWELNPQPFALLIQYKLYLFYFYV